MSAVETSPWKSRPFHLMAKPTGARCNLDCKYCFFLEKESLYPGSHFRMPADVQEEYIRQTVNSQHTPEVTITWQGGEPTLMGLPFFRRSVELARRYAKPGQRISHQIQTNGTLLDDAWCAFLHEHQFLVGISLDGPAFVHDPYRVDKMQRPTFESVMRGVRLLQKHRGRLQYPGHPARREPGPSPGGLPLLPGRSRCGLGAIHPYRRKNPRYGSPGRDMRSVFSVRAPGAVRRFPGCHFR